MVERAAEPTSEGTTVAIPPVDRHSDSSVEQHYLKVLDRLLADALDNGHLQILADTLAWTAAKIVVGCGVAAAGDILQRMGRYVDRLWEGRRAQEEAELAKKEGRLPH